MRAHVFLAGKLDLVFVCLCIYRGFISHSVLFSVYRGVWCKFLEVNFPMEGLWKQQTNVGDVHCVELGVINLCEVVIDC